MDGYYRLEAYEVPVHTRLAAHRFAKSAARELGIEVPRVTWWRSSGGVWHGWVEVDELNINLVLDKLYDLGQIKSATYHEIRHLWQYATGRYLSPGADDRDATHWAYQMTNVMPLRLMKGE